MTTATERHTTDLTISCLRRRKLTLDGHAKGEATTALFRGIMAGLAVEYAYRSGMAADCVQAAVIDAWNEAERQCKAEGRPLSEAVQKHKSSLMVEVKEAVANFCRRFRDVLNSAKQVHFEVPIRWTIDVDGEAVEFASHLDMLMQDAGGEWHVWDFKFRAEQPGPFYLSRNMQLAMYWLAVAHGEVCINDWWCSVKQRPHVAWIHLPHLMPYKQKVTTKDDGGEEREFKKGDDRPTRTIVHSVPFRDEAAILDEFRLRERMFRAGHFPTNPDPVGCRICECAHACPSFAFGGNQ